MDEYSRALILAAGFSERMNAFKPLLPLGGADALSRLVDTYRRAGVAAVTVVTGHNAPEVEAAVAAKGVAVARNPHPEGGMFSSVRAGIASLPESTGQVFIQPVDVPLVRPDTIVLLERESLRSDAAVLVPRYNGAAGHPPLIRAEAFPRILESAGEGGLRALIPELGWRPVPVADRQILFDMDTPEEYEEARRRAANPAGLVPEEAELLLRLFYRQPEHLVRHARTVAALTAKMADALIRNGVPVGRDLAVSGAWLHDLAKGTRGHAAAGGAELRKIGLDALAAIVENHNRCAWPDSIPMDERVIVDLADKQLLADKPVGHERRFAAKIAANRGDPEEAHIQADKLRHVRRTARRFEALAGRSLASLLGEAEAALKREGNADA